MKLRYGIREKTVAMVMVLSTLPVIGVGWYLFHANKAILVDHELVDLGDEAQLRAWELANRIDVMKDDLRTVAHNEKLRTLLEGGASKKELNDALEKSCREWDGYCSISLIESGKESEEIFFDTPVKATFEAEEDRQRLVALEKLKENVWTMKAPRRPMVSDIVLISAELEAQNREAYKKRLPVIWGATRVEVGGTAGGDAEEKKAWVFLFALNLYNRSWESDPRHLTFLVDAKTRQYVIHPKMDSQAHLGHLGDGDVFGLVVKKEGKKVVEKLTIDTEIANQQNTAAQQTAQSTVTRIDPPMTRIADVRQVDLAEEYWGYFRSGTVTDLFMERLKALSDWQEQAWEKKGVTELDYNIFSHRLRSLTDTYVARHLKVGGLTNKSRTMRLMGRSPKEVRKLSSELGGELGDYVARRVREGEVGEILPKGIENLDETGDFGDAKMVNLHRVILCDHADISGVQMEIAYADGAVEKETAEAKEYWFLYVGFREELGASVESELMNAIQTALLGVFLAGLIAFVAAYLSVLPLIRMIEGARALARSREDRLHANIRQMTKAIPVGRKDEVGDIARAAKKLFEAVTTSHHTLTKQKAAIEHHKDELKIEVEKATAELKAKNAELELAAEEKDKFLATVSHELRTPLTIVAGNLQLLLRKPLGEKEKRYVHKAMGASERLEALIRDLLDIQKIIMGGLSLDPAEFSVTDLLDEVRESLQPAAKARGNEFRVEYQNLEMAFGDKVRLHQILTNLVSNSCKFTENGVVAIDADAWVDEGGQKWMRFLVSDTGRGMSEEEQTKIFKRFYTNKKANESGTGLGLDICRGLCELMGGRVFLKDSAPGKGSTFEVELPQTMPGGPATEPQPEKKGGGARSNQKRLPEMEGVEEALGNLPVNKDDPPKVMVIDDEPGIRDLMKQHLLDRGYRVITANSGDEGLAKATEENPDLITLDVMMDGTDGWETLQRFKANPKTSSIPVVMVTILDREDKGFTLGADDYITKPVDWDHLFAVLGRLTTAKDGNRVLVIEDDENTRQLFKSVLSKAGWKVREAGNGREALDDLKKEVADVIVLDLMMPIMDGIAFLEQFKREPAWQNIPVIVVTAKVMSAEERKKIDESVAQVIEKGTRTAAELLEEIQNWATRARGTNRTKGENGKDIDH